MRRREFVGLLGGATSSIASPLAARAQQAERSYRVSYLALLPGKDATLPQPFSMLALADEVIE